MSPQDFEHALERVAPLSYVYHGRPPTMREIGDLAGKASHEVRRYFADLPDKHHPELTAHEMVSAYQAARPWARQHLEREPVKSEAAYLHHSKENPSAYYERLAAAQNTQEPNAVPPEVRPDRRGSGIPAPGRQEAGQ